MEQTLQALAGILQKAIPTIFIILLLHFYLKGMLFKPLEKVLKQRDELTVGARQEAEESLKRAEEKAAQYEAALRDARSEIYREQEQARARLLADQESRLDSARARIHTMIEDAKTEVERETAAAKLSLRDQTSVLADQIASSILPGRVS
jgi:F-type H+-transporting ATPase subunit b